MGEYEIPRNEMISRLRDHYKIQDESVLDAMSKIPRHEFVPAAMKFQAYRDNALPIASKQTISQPYIVARMTELLELNSRSKILEIGAGSGYQTLVLSQLAGSVFAIERVEKLTAEASERLKKFDVRNVTLKCDDGTNGWKAYAPYDGILVAAGSPEVPKPLLNQLKDGGKLVIPVGQTASSQILLRVTKNGNRFETEDFGKCTFVPLIGAHGWN